MKTAGMLVLCCSFILTACLVTESKFYTHSLEVESAKEIMPFLDEKASRWARDYELFTLKLEWEEGIPKAIASYRASSKPGEKIVITMENNSSVEAMVLESPGYYEGTKHVETPDWKVDSRQALALLMGAVHEEVGKIEELCGGLRLRRGSFFQEDGWVWVMSYHSCQNIYQGAIVYLDAVTGEIYNPLNETPAP